MLTSNRVPYAVVMFSATGTDVGYLLIAVWVRKICYVYEQIVFLADFMLQILYDDYYYYYYYYSCKSCQLNFK
jgi:hypothetical protein